VPHKVSGLGANKKPFFAEIYIQNQNIFVLFFCLSQIFIFFAISDFGRVFDRSSAPEESPELAYKSTFEMILGTNSNFLSKSVHKSAI
jgi:hypothetical protein